MRVCGYWANQEKTINTLTINLSIGSSILKQAIEIQVQDTGNVAAGQSRDGGGARGAKGVSKECRRRGIILFPR